jgi:hypothetical protein
MSSVHKKKNVLYWRIFTFLLSFAFIAVVQGGAKSKKTTLNEKFRNISKEMNAYYDNGELNRVIELYKNECCEEVEVKKKKVEAREKREFKKVKDDIRADIYQWVALSYIALDRPEKGDIYIRKLLVLRWDEGVGDYWLSIRNTAQNKYDVVPRLLLGFRLGPNFTTVHPGSRIRVFENDPAAGKVFYDKDYSFHFTRSRGLQWNVILEYALTRNFSLSLQPALSEMLFKYKNRYEWEGEGNITRIEAKFNHHQRMNYVEIPLLLKYQFERSKLKPYIQMGGFFGILYLAHKSIESDITQTLTDSKKIDEKETIKDITIMKQIKNYHVGFLLGGGIGIDTGIKGLRLGVEVNYKQGLNNIVDEAHRYDNHKLVYGYYDVFDDMKLRTVDLTIKVLLPISFKAFKK